MTITKKADFACLLYVHIVVAFCLSGPVPAHKLVTDIMLYHVCSSRTYKYNKYIIQQPNSLLYFDRKNIKKGLTFKLI